ncbi:hypothetical protein P175DRAFT_0292484 [Aspergillus ochraceoroseus IBT 24754]|uniref:Uncharacterized protein n=1 Tax=Aspergillus ochraceoroseus IBT 24754 TaxID=1392256 RepID=A0A2T5LSH2_9EURO|nr:uncharacterized protein P175DRAFT_0292484 [Aspergillus ochraceoroseus IBT 24754]PTU19224.1 hypothetical protein P175DRAFT_0292484 [Aspergillus ochraceoroseus IBT 24754]
MGSFLSIQNRDKRRRSNRLSKPPQIKSTPNSIHSRSPLQPSTPSTSAWQNPWTNVSIPVSPTDIESNPGQSFPSNSLQSETAWNPPARGPEPWLSSPTSPTSSASRPGSLYRRASFQPSQPVTFQPTTLQTTPPSPLIGQPRRSYSVHAPPHRSRSTIHPNTPEATTFSSHSTVEGQGNPLIRRRSLLTRPGIATRRSTKERVPQFSVEPCQNTLFPISSQAILPSTTELSPPDHEENLFNRSISPSHLRPPTPSEFEYTHLGALKLGSLRVVNGSASPCSSDRTRLNCAGSPVPESIHDGLHPVELFDRADSLRNRTHEMEASMSPDRLDTSSPCHEMISDSKGLDTWIGGSSGGRGMPTGISPQNQGILSRDSRPATSLNIPPLLISGKYDDVPGSPFSYEKSPTVLAPRGMGPSETEDEGITIPDGDRIFIPLPEKAPERNLSYRGFSHSHKKVDSGYSSATSVRSLQDSRHRVSIESHRSPQRSPAFRRFTLGGSSRDLEIGDSNRQSNLGSQLPLNRHLSLQDQKMNSRPDVTRWPTSMCHEPQQMQVNGRLRSSSLTTAETSSRMVSVPLYCTQLRSLESAALESPLPLFSQANTAKLEETSESLYPRHIHGALSDLYPDCSADPVPVNYDHGDDRLKTALDGRTAALLTGDHTGDSHHSCHNFMETCGSISGNNSPKKSPTSVADRQEPQRSSAVKSEIRFPRSSNEPLFPPTPSSIVENNAALTPRGRTRTRSIDYQRRKSSKPQPPKVYA